MEIPKLSYKYRKDGLTQSRVYCPSSIADLIHQLQIMSSANELIAVEPQYFDITLHDSMGHLVCVIALPLGNR